MFSDTQFWRLVWKEYRVHRPLWLVLLVGTPLMQIFFLTTLWLFNHSGQGVWGTPDGIVAVFGVGFAASFIYLLGCGATAFSIEHESGNFECQRVLPIRMPRVPLAKAGFALVSGMALALLVWVFTRGIFGPEAHARMVGEWFGPLGLLYLSEVLAWSLCASMLVRQPLWSVVAAVCAHALMNYVVLAVLTGPFEADQFSPFQSSTTMVCCRIAVLAILCLADVVLGWLWIEDRLRLPRWRIRWKPDFAPSYLASAELPAYVGQRQAGWKRLLWLSWRDGRWLMAGGLASYGYVFLTLRHPNDWVGLMLVELVVSFAFGLFTFAPEQWGGRFRFMTERGCLPRTAWLCRQVIWLLPILLMCVGTFRIRAFENRGYQHIAFDVMMSTVAPWICFAAAQLTAMLVRSTAVSIAIGFGLAVIGCMWGGLMTSWLAPIWWAVGSLPAIGLFVTWLKVNDWVEERRDRIARWRTVLSLGVPIALLLAATVTDRVVQIPVAPLPSEWDGDTTTVLAQLTLAEKETLAIYRRALSEIESNDNRHENYEVWFKRIREEHPDWTEREIRAETFESSNRDWWQRHVSLVPLLREAHRLALVPLALAEVDEGGQLSSHDPFLAEQLPRFMVWQAKQSLRDGNLDQTWEDILIAFELEHRYSQRAALTKQVGMFRYGTIHKRQLLEIVAEWSRQPEQTRDRIVAAIRKLEEFIASRDEGRREVHHRFLEAQSLFNEADRWGEHLSTMARASTSGHRQNWGEEVAVYWKLWKFFPWERWRSERAARFHTWRSLAEVDQLQTSLKWNVPERYSVALSSRTGALERATALAPAEEQGTLLALSLTNPNSTERVMLQATLLPPSLRLGFPTTAESNFWDLATSYRATMLLLALADFHREQGRYPESLNELAPSYFTEVPRDPKTAGPFVYFPHGVPEEVTSGSEDDRQFYVIVRKSIPFLMAWNNRGSPSYRIDSRQKPGGDWEFIDSEGKTLELPTAFRRGARIWTLPVP